MVPGGIFGKRKALLDIPETAPRDWYGFRQAIPTRSGRSYLVAGWIESDGPADIWLHDFSKRTPDVFNNVPVFVPGSGWRPFVMNVAASHSESVIEIHLTSTAGKRAYDGILIAEIIPVATAKFESYSDRNAQEPLLAGQVNPLVKIFPDTVPVEGRPLSVSLARNEAEGLQLAVRSHLAYPSLTVSASAPKNEAGAELPMPEPGVIGHVRVDTESRYLQFTGTPFYQRCVPADVVPILYPDPILPCSEFRLEPGKTQGLYLRVRAPRDAEPGRLSGNGLIQVRRQNH